MSERDHLVEDLVAEVLGPRGGPVERLGGDEDPLDEYIVGVLAPFSSPSVEVDSVQELVGDELLDGGRREQPAAALSSVSSGITGLERPRADGSLDRDQG
ncbi:hypothetical protein [Streptomyces buecherae]|uniref:hypothetical protein n=1 Tax=Streptomyces buecherae TaxID=2763006 RepID=UPI0037A181E8